MIACLKNDFKRALNSKNTLLAIIISTIFYIIGLYDVIDFVRFDLREFRDVYDAIDMFINIRVSYLALVIPIIASLPFSASYIMDIETGYLKFIYSRMSKRKYLVVRTLTNSLISGIVILISSVFIFIVLFFIFGINYNSKFNEVSSVWISLYFYDKVYYFLFLLIMSFIFNVAFSTLSLGLSPYLKNKYLTILSSFIYYVISATIFISLHLYKFNAVLLFHLEYLTIGQILLYDFALITIGTILFYIGVQYKNEDNI
ncbi:hypothetical protein ACTFIN_06240 [Clostridium cagae]|nr:hypothetical protein [Clostridium sp. ZBS14]